MYNIDIETYSSVDLKKHGVYKYVESPDFEITLFGVKHFFSGEVKVFDLANGEKVLREILDNLVHDNVIARAWNATFERICINKFFGIETKKWRCTQLRAMTLGLPPSLGKCAEILGIEEQKIKTNLVHKFSKPNRKGEKVPRTGPEWEEFKKYCAQDVRTEAAVDKELPTIPVEWSLYDHNSDVNDRGVLIDLDLVNSAIYLDSEFKKIDLIKLKELTGLDNPNSDTQMKKWLGEAGWVCESLAKDKVKEKLGHLRSGREALEDLNAHMPKAQYDDLVQSNENISKALKLRAKIKNVSVKKYEKMKLVACEDDRIHGALQFYGATATGRYAGRLVQPQNIYRNRVDGEELSKLRQMIKDGQDPREIFGGDALSQAIRTAFTAPEGLTAIDFSAIEARVLSWIAGEQWRNEIFATHGKIYEATAAKYYDISIDEVTPEQRKTGKTMELALGYQGGVGAFRRFGAKGTDEELDEMKFAWRRACPKIVQLWWGVNDSIMKVMNYGVMAQVGDYLRIGLKTHGPYKWLVIQLPSNRCLYYFDPRFGIGVEGNFSPDDITYMKLNEKGQYVRTYGYGGKFVENITQAIARDCLVVGLMRLQHLPVVLHVHDEIVIEGDYLDEAKKALEAPIKWAPGLILRAEGYFDNYYKK